MEVEDPSSSASSESTSRGTKRSASVIDESSQPPDKKLSSARPRKSPHIPDRAIESPHGGIISLLSANQSGPISVVDTQFFVFNYDNINNIIDMWRNALIELLYPGQNEPVSIVTENEWRNVIKSAIKSRIDHVFAGQSGRRSDYRIPLMRNYELPLAIAEIINGLGVIHIQNGAILCCPQAPDPPVDATQRLTALTTHQALNRSAALIEAAKRRNFINTGFISSVNTGTAFWMLSPRQTFNPSLLADGNTGNVTIRSTFKEWTPSDSVYAAIVQHPTTGYVPNTITGDIYTSDPITDVEGIRRSHLCGA